jgi:hypothetical protein
MRLEKNRIGRDLGKYQARQASSAGVRSQLKEKWFSWKIVLNLSHK